jgi:hypothetical protein
MPFEFDEPDREEGENRTIAETCDACGDYVRVGAWPFCASAANPAGHDKGVAYGWRMNVGMGTQGWTRREK